MEIISKNYLKIILAAVISSFLLFISFYFVASPMFFVLSATFLIVAVNKTMIIIGLSIFAVGWLLITHSIVKSLVPKNLWFNTYVLIVVILGTIFILFLYSANVSSIKRNYAAEFIKTEKENVEKIIFQQISLGQIKEIHKYRFQRIDFITTKGEVIIMKATTDEFKQTWSGCGTLCEQIPVIYKSSNSQEFPVDRLFD